MSVPPLTRRGLLRGSALAAVSAVVGYVVARNSAAADDKPLTAGANAYGPGSGHGGTVLTTVDAIPQGGEIIGGIVLTRTDSGEVHAVSATCTHEGCTVGRPSNGTVTCPCHGSEFNATTGAVLRGPANRPLPAVAVTVQGNQVVRT